MSWSNDVEGFVTPGPVPKGGDNPVPLAGLEEDLPGSGGGGEPEGP